MTEIHSFEEHTEIIKAFRQGEMLRSNCYMLPDEIYRLCSEGRMFAVQNDEWLFVLCDYDDYYLAYYYAFYYSMGGSAKELFESTRLSKPVLLDVTFRGRSGDRETVKSFLSCGLFSEYKTYKRLILQLKKTESEAFKTEIAPGYELSKTADYDDVLSLWEKTLDEKSTPFPNRHAFMLIQNSGCFFALTDEKGSLACVLVLSRRGRNATIEHVACAPQHRRKGLAESLIKTVLQFAEDDGISTVKLWVDEKNVPALSLYEKLGFLDEKTRSEQYIKI